MHALIHELQAEFPHPVRYQDAFGRPDAYCVGAALVAATYATSCRHLEMTAFPSTIEIADALRDLNPTLSVDAAYTLADRILHFNDTGWFEKAWQYADKALVCQDVPEAD